MATDGEPVITADTVEITGKEEVVVNGVFKIDFDSEILAVTELES